MGIFSSIGSALGGVVGGPVGAAIGGAVGAGIESSQAAGASEAASAAAAADRARALKAAKEGVDVAKEFLSDWESIYGGIEDNLSSFFSSLTPERFVALGLQNLQKEFQITRQRLGAEFAQRGISGSGIEISTDILLEAQRAKGRAQIRTDAPFKVAEATSKFLALGIGQKLPIQQGVTNALRAKANVLLGFATGATEAAATAATSAGVIQGEFGAAIEDLGGIFAGGFGGSGVEDFGRTFDPNRIPIPGRKPDIIS